MLVVIYLSRYIIVKLAISRKVIVKKIFSKPKGLVSMATLATSLLIFFSVNPAHAESTIQNTIDIEVTTHLGDKQNFQQGDVISFLISLDRDAFVLMIYEDAEHNLVQIIPNRYRQSNQYKTGLFMSVPNRDEPFEFVVSPPFGKETIWVFAAEQEFPELKGTVLDNGLKKLSDKFPTVLSKIRADKTKQLYGEASTTITTAAK